MNSGSMGDMNRDASREDKLMDIGDMSRASINNEGMNDSGAVLI